MFQVRLDKLKDYVCDHLSITDPARSNLHKFDDPNTGILQFVPSKIGQDKTLLSIEDNVMDYYEKHGFNVNYNLDRRMEIVSVSEVFGAKIIDHGNFYDVIVTR